MFAFAQAQHKGDLQDKEFEANPDKKASLRKMREGEDLHSGKLYYFMTQPPFGAKLINDSLHLVRKCARIFVREHYRLREADSFPGA